jgi:hypothetical protein
VILYLVSHKNLRYVCTAGSLDSIVSGMIREGCRPRITCQQYINPADEHGLAETYAEINRAVLVLDYWRYIVLSRRGEAPVTLTFSARSKKDISTRRCFSTIERDFPGADVRAVGPIVEPFGGDK